MKEMSSLSLWSVAYHAVQASFTGREVAGLATLEGISATAAIVKVVVNVNRFQCQILTQMYWK